MRAEESQEVLNWPREISAVMGGNPSLEKEAKTVQGKRAWKGKDIPAERVCLRESQPGQEFDQ